MALEPGWSAERILDALVDALDEAVLLFDAEHRCRAAGRRAGPIFGVDVAALVGVPRAELLQRLAAASDDPAAFDAAIGAASSAPQLVELARPERRAVLWTTVRLGPGEAGVLADVVRDVSAERAAAVHVAEMTKALAEATTIDPVTGLLNQRRFSHDLDREHRRAQRVWESYAIARIDVNGMAAINAAVGWTSGDALLRRIGEELRTARREYDLVGRWRADEFILCLPGVDAAAARGVLERTLAATYDRVRESFGRTVAMSVGVAVWIPPSADGPDDMIQRAGVALDLARRRSGSEIVVDARAGRWKDSISDE